MEFDSCTVHCQECKGIDVVAVGEDDLFICKHTEKILEKVDETTLKEM